MKVIALFHVQSLMNPVIFYNAFHRVVRIQIDTLNTEALKLNMRRKGMRKLRSMVSFHRPDLTNIRVSEAGVTL